jgi:hypothetical protein
MNAQLFQFDWWGVLDAGMFLNRATGRSTYLRGELYQAHFMIGRHEVWAEWNRRTGMYRMQVGAKPNPDAETIDRREYERRILWLQQDACRQAAQ